MPCRAANVAPKCLWVTDDILADAFNRFARVSHAHRRRVEGRRYGSHVPGPLEAHRRSSKRSMGVAAVASSIPPPGVDLGSLFGLGGFTSDRKVDDWKWHPPGVEERPKSSNWLFGGERKKRKDAWEAFLEAPEQKAEDPVEKSRHAFEELLAEKEHYDKIGQHDIKDLTDFLRTSANELEAHNTLQLVKWLAAKHLTEDSFANLYTLLLEKIQLQTLGDGELSSILSVLLQWDISTRHATDIAALLDALPDEGLADICVSVTQSTLEQVDSEKALPPQTDLWLRALRSVRLLQGDHRDNDIWRKVYDLVALTFPDLTVVKHHLSTLKKYDLSRVLLRHWVPHITCDATGDMTVTSVGDAKWLTRSPEHQPDVHQLFHEFEHLASSYTRSRRSYFSSSLVQLIALLHDHLIPHTGLCRGIFEVLMLSNPPRTVYRIFHGITHYAAVGVDNALAQALVHYFLAQNKTEMASQVFKTVPTLPLSACYDLPIALAKNHLISGTRIWTILQRLTPEDIVITPSAPRSKLSSDHVDLINLIAFNVAHSKRMTYSRSVFRRVWECYLFLRDRCLTVQPMLTRALVIAGIIRPLQESGGASFLKIRFVLKLVEEAEGKEVAEKIDRIVWKMWQEQIQPNRANRALGSQMEAREEDDAAKETATRSYKQARNWLFPARNRKLDASYEPFSAQDHEEGEDPDYSAKAPTEDGDLNATMDLMRDLAAELDQGPLPQEQQLATNLSSSSAFSLVTPPLSIPAPAETLASAYEHGSVQNASLQNDLPVVASSERRSGLGYDDDLEPHSPVVQVEVAPRVAYQTQPAPQELVPATTTTFEYTPMGAVEGLGGEVSASTRWPSHGQCDPPRTTIENAPGPSVSKYDPSDVQQDEMESAAVEMNTGFRIRTYQSQGWTYEEEVLSSLDYEWKTLNYTPRGTKVMHLNSPNNAWRGRSVPLDGVTDYFLRTQCVPLQLLVRNSVNVEIDGEVYKPVGVSRMKALDDATRVWGSRCEWVVDSLNLPPDHFDIAAKNLHKPRESARRKEGPRKDSPDTKLPMQVSPSSRLERPQSRSKPKPEPDSKTSFQTLRSKAELRSLELRCWENSISPSSSVPIHEFLRWEGDSYGRGRLTVEWQGGWKHMIWRWVEVQYYRRVGALELARALDARMEAAGMGRAEGLEEGMSSPGRKISAEERERVAVKGKREVAADNGGLDKKFFEGRRTE